MAALAAAVFSSCSKDSENASVNEGNAIEFRAVTEKQRASLISSTAELTEFLVKADKGDEDFSFMPGTVVSKHTGSWSYSPKKYYPTTAGTTVDFYAHYPIVDPNMTAQMAYDGSDVTFEYLVPADQSAATSKAKDLLVASVTGQDTGTVIFDFNHALSSVMVTAINENTAAAAELSYVVSKVEITELNTTGTYTFGAATPWAVSVPATYKANVLSVAVGAGQTQPLMTSEAYLMVLPQTIAATSKVQVTYTITDGAGVVESDVKEFELATKLAAGFEAGKRYNLTFKFSAREGIAFDVNEVVGWVDAPTNI